MTDGPRDTHELEILPAGDPPAALNRQASIPRNLSYGELQHVDRAIKNGLFDTPFRDWEPNEIKDLAKEFAKLYKLAPKIVKMEIFEKAGEVLWNPDAWTRLLRVKTADGEDYLSQDDEAALKRAQGGFGVQPKIFKVTICTLCIAAVVQGWTQTVGNGANLQWPKQLGLKSLGGCHPTSHDIWIFACVNAAVYLAAGLSACLLADPLSEYLLGRRAPIFVSAVLVFASAIGSASSTTWQALLANRIVMGIGMGCKATVVPVFAAEIAPAHIRGTLVMNWQLFDALGIFLGFSANLAVSRAGPSTWRWQTASLCLPSIVLIFLIWICPDSPRYQMKISARRRRRKFGEKWEAICDRARRTRVAFSDAFRTCFGKQPSHPISPGGPTAAPQMQGSTNPENTPATEQNDRATTQHEPLEELDYSCAFKTLCDLRDSPLLAAKEIVYMHVQMIIEQRHIVRDYKSTAKGSEALPAYQTSQPNDKLERLLKNPSINEISYVRKLCHLWTIPRVRRATGCAIVCMLSQQLCGVNVLAFYSSTLFQTTIHCSGRNHLYTVQHPTDLNPLWLSWSIGITNFVMGLPAYWLIESRGRRWLLLVTTPIMALTMLIICMGYLLPSENSSRIPLIVAFILIFMVFYSLGMGPVPFTISSEVFPLEYRLAGMSLGVFVNLFGAGLLALFVPIITSTQLHNIGLTGIFTGLNVFAFFLIALFVRETAKTGNTTTEQSKKSMSLEELFRIFSMSIQDYLKDRKMGIVRYLVLPFEKLKRSHAERGSDRKQKP